MPPDANTTPAPRPLRIAFLLNDLALSGGVGVVVTHARNLAEHHGFDVTLVLVREHEAPAWAYEQLPQLRVLPLEAAAAERFDVAVSTWWETAYPLFQIPAERYAAFVQSLEDRFYDPAQEADRLGARAALDLPVAFITEAEWIAGTLRDLRPDAGVRLVRNGVAKDVFGPVPDAAPEHDGPLRVLVEGDPRSAFKGVAEAVRSVELMREPHELTVVAPNRANLEGEGLRRAIGPLSQRELAEVYARTDVLVKLSRVEGMYGPPLEAFHRGATCVTTEVTGSEEYIRHGENALITGWDDERGTARRLDLLARDRELLRTLREGALQTARDWPDWEASSAEMAEALRGIAADPPPAPYAGAASLTRTLTVGIARERALVRDRRSLLPDARHWRRLAGMPVMRHLFALRRALLGRERRGGDA